MFDFPNYTFSGLLSLIAAVFGISYPLILDSISRLNDKYNGTIITSYFLEERRYKIFKYLLIINLIIAVSLPFVLYASNSKFIHALMVSQTAGVILLILFSFLLYELIIVYQKPGSLLERLKSRFKGPTPPVLEMNELSLYLSKRDDNILFQQSWACVADYVSEKIKSLDESQKFPEEIEIIVNRQKRLINLCNIQEDSFFSQNNVITSLLYPSFTDHFYHPRTHSLIWRLLNTAARGNNLPWIMSHWSSMDQYYSCHSYSQNSDKWIIHKEFLDVSNIMLGGLLTFYKRYDIINELLFFSHSIPPKYYLLPNSLGEIKDRIEKLEKCLNKFLFIEGHFQFEGLEHGVQTDSAIYHEAIKFLSLCVIRLWSIKQYYYGSEPLDIPNSNGNLRDLERLVQVLSLINECIKEWGREDIFNHMKSLEKVDIHIVNEKIEEWIQSLKDRCKCIENNPTTNEVSINKFKEELVIESLNPSFLLPSRHDSLLVEPSITESHIEYFYYPVDKILFDPQFSISYTNLPSVCISALVRPTIQKYLNFIKSPNNRIFKIQQKDVFRALSMLKVDKDNHYILISGVYLKNFENLFGKVDGLDTTSEDIKYNNVTIHPINGNMQTIFIIPKKCLPYVEYCDYPQKDSLMPLNINCKIYSNLNEMSDHNDGLQFPMILRRHVTLYKEEDSANYQCVQLNIEYDSSLGALDIDMVQW